MGKLPVSLKAVELSLQLSGKADVAHIRLNCGCCEFESRQGPLLMGNGTARVVISFAPRTSDGSVTRILHHYAGIV